jgi:hypothetical protein
VNTKAPKPEEIFDKSPLKWIEERDLEELSFAKATWVPLTGCKVDVLHGKFGLVGYRKGYRDFESIIVPLELRQKYLAVDWQSIARRGPDSAWVDRDRFVPPGSFEGTCVLYSVIKRSFETGEPEQWDLLQELEVGLKLFRRGDVWICPDENDIEVARLDRDAEGTPELLVFRAEYLRDYLCAKSAALLLTGFAYREAVESEFPNVNWPEKREERRFAHGQWEGTLLDIHAGGDPIGMKTTVFHVWRESVSPDDDTPEMPDPMNDPGMQSKSFTVEASGEKHSSLSGRIWLKHWISPAPKSPRIKRDEIEARIPFYVDNQEQKTLFGKALEKYRGWLWFKPQVIQQLLEQPKGRITWYTANTGEVGPASNQTLHFGVNRLGLINVLGYKMAELPEWVQKLWSAANVCPDGGISEELHMSQNLAQPADTRAAEVILWNNLRLLQRWTTEKYQQALLRQLPGKNEFFRRIHRFADSFEDVCRLCKELHRTVCEPIDLGLMNAIIDPANAVEANKNGLREIKRVAMWLDSLKLNGRDITRALAGVADLRQGDAHSKSKQLRESFKLFGIPQDSVDYQKASRDIIGHVANAVGAIATAVGPHTEKGGRPNTSV